MNQNAIIYLDGAYLPLSEAKVSVLDHGLLYGDGIFEGIRVYNKRVFKLGEHVERFFECAKALMLNPPLSREETQGMVLETCKRNHIEDGYIRLVMTRGVGDLGMSPSKCGAPSLICIVDTISLYPADMYESGIPVITAQQRRNSAANLDPQIKSLNYLNNILAKIEANHAGAQEAILLNQNGVVAGMHRRQCIHHQK